MAKPGDVGFARFRHLRRGFVRRDRGGRGAAHPAAGAARSGAARQAQGLVWWRHLVDLGNFFCLSRTLAVCTRSPRQDRTWPRHRTTSSTTAPTRRAHHLRPHAPRNASPSKQAPRRGIVVLAGEPPAKIFTVGFSYWRISKETYHELPTRRVNSWRGAARVSLRGFTLCQSELG